MRDMLTHLDIRPAIVPVAAASADNTPLVSTILNRLGFESVVLAIVTGNLADADATFAVTLDHGDMANLSDASAVPADQLNGSLVNAGFTFTHDSAARKIGYVGNKQYVRATITPSNNAGAAPIVATWILATPNMMPTAGVPG